MKLRECDNCHLQYPEELLNPLFIDGEYTKPMCGICALEITNKHHGVRRTSFTGQMAEGMRQAAIRWREKHEGK